METTVVAHDLTFRLYIDEQRIQERVQALGKEINRLYADKNPLFLGVLNGAFIFTADLVRACNIDCEISFVRLSSYRGVQSTGEVSALIGPEAGSIEGRHLIIVEDIVDTGKTLSVFCEDLQQLKPASVAIASLLLKPEALEHPLKVDFLGFSIPPAFVIGYGLDYDGAGRHLPAIYQKI